MMTWHFYLVKKHLSFMQCWSSLRQSTFFLSCYLWLLGIEQRLRINLLLWVVIFCWKAVLGEINTTDSQQCTTDFQALEDKLIRRQLLDCIRDMCNLLFLLSLAVSRKGFIDSSVIKLLNVMMCLMLVTPAPLTKFDQSVLRLFVS